MSIPNDLIAIMAAYSQNPAEIHALVQQLTPLENRTPALQKALLKPLKREFLDSMASMIQAANLSLKERLGFQMSMIRPIVEMNLANFPHTKSALISQLFALTKTPHDTFRNLLNNRLFKEAFDFVNIQTYAGRRDGALVLNSGTDTRTIIMDLLRLQRIDEAIELGEKAIDLQHDMRVIEPLIKYLCLNKELIKSFDLVERVIHPTRKDGLLVCMSSTLISIKRFGAAHKACKQIYNIDYRESQLLTLCTQLIQHKEVMIAEKIAKQIKNPYKRQLAESYLAKASSNLQDDHPLNPPPA